MVLSTLSTVTQYTARVATLGIDVFLIQSDLQEIFEGHKKFKNLSSGEQMLFGTMVASAVANLALPLVALCLRKAAPHHAKRVSIAAQALRLGAAAGRSYTAKKLGKTVVVGELTSTLLEEIALYKQRHLLAGLGAAGRIATRIQACRVLAAQQQP